MLHLNIHGTISWFAQLALLREVGTPFHNARKYVAIVAVGSLPLKSLRFLTILGSSWSHLGDSGGVLGRLGIVLGPFEDFRVVLEPS